MSHHKPERSPPDPLFLAIDQGGHSTRAMVFDGHGSPQAKSAVPISTARPRPGWVEHDPNELVQSVRHALAEIAGLLGPRLGRLTAAGMATQRSSLVCWDRDSGKPLSPVLSWQDHRGAEQVGALRSRADMIRTISGLVLSPHYGASKLRWCIDHLAPVQRALDQRCLAYGPLASFLLFHLLDESPHLVDPATAQRTQAWDVTNFEWSPTLLRLFRLPRQPLPDCVPSRHLFGRLHLAGVTIPLTVVTGDQSAALFADAEPGPQTVVINLGTGAFLQRATPEPPFPTASLLKSLVWGCEERTVYALEGTVNGAGSAVTEVGRALGLQADEIEAKAAEWLDRRGRPPLFLNGIGGLGSPFWVADFPTRFVGSGESWEQIVAVYESILFLLAINLEAMATQIGPPAELRVTGGLAGLDALCQGLADLSGIPVSRPNLHDATARGTAYLVAESPVDWSESEVERFLPDENLDLQSRNQCWRQEMQTTLAALG